MSEQTSFHVSSDSFERTKKYLCTSDHPGEMSVDQLLNLADRFAIHNPNFAQRILKQALEA